MERAEIIYVKKVSELNSTFLGAGTTAAPTGSTAAPTGLGYSQVKTFRLCTLTPFQQETV